jgi:hypothetical protein
MKLLARSRNAHNIFEIDIAKNVDENLPWQGCQIWRYHSHDIDSNLKTVSKYSLEDNGF